MQSGLDFSARTLRKLMAVHDYEKSDKSLGLIEGINNGTYKIDAAFKLMKSKICKKVVKEGVIGSRGFGGVGHSKKKNHPSLA